MKMDNVIKLETVEQDCASDELSLIAEFACNGHRISQNYLKKLWPECSWSTIKDRLNAEGSVWYVWWMDGVNQHLLNVEKLTS